MRVVTTLFYLLPTVLCWCPASHTVKSVSSEAERNRRSFLSTILIGTSFATSSTLLLPTQSAAVAASEYAPSDEVTLQIPKKDIQAGLGLELADITFRTNLRVYVKSIAPQSRAASLGIQRDWIVVALNGKSLERTNAAGVQQYIREALQDSATTTDTVALTFRDPSVFSAQLQNLSPQNSIATTQVAPAGDTTQRFADGSVRPGKSVTTAVKDQRVTVEQLQAPRLCQRGATTDDLLEIAYTGSVVETGTIFDGSALELDGKGIPGRGGDTTMFFVLGKQPFGQFPPSWDVGLKGMCVGERRRLVIPPALGYGSTGVPRRNIPPDATLQYDVTLLSLNGLATPQ